MKKVINQVRRMKSVYWIVRQYFTFYQRDFTSPSPTFFKMKTLERYANSDGIWLETGTYMGDTSKYLAKRYPKVISIEPSDFFYKYASEKLNKFGNVTVLNGTSEELFENAFISVSPCANIWLDGHYSEGETFLGGNVTPIVDELQTITRHKDKFNSLTLFIDDIRCFPRSSDVKNGYPQFQWLIKWCEDNNFVWELQNDILIAQMRT
jgi:hypothetical protein